MQIPQRSGKNLLALVCLGGLILTSRAQPYELFIAANGDDRAAGTRERPFATPERARDAVRALKQRGPLPPEGVTVWLAAGSYERTHTFELDQRDSGEPGKPIVYRAVPGANVRVSGGRSIAPDAFTPVTDDAIHERLDHNARDHIRQCELRQLGIRDLGTLDRDTLRGGPMLELFFNDRALPISRWPTTGWATYGNVIDQGSIPRWQEKPDRPGVLEYSGDRPQRWRQADNVWLHGYYAFDWYDDVLKVKELDTEKRRITFTTPHTYGLKPNRRYAAINLIEEIDSPGEWVLDRGTGVLYLYPPEPMDAARIVVSMVAEPLVRMQQASHLTLQGLTFEFGRGKAVEMLGGTDNLIAGCTVRNLGTSAIDIRESEGTSRGHILLETGDPVKDGRRNGVVGCDIYNVGTGGISLQGGDRATLTPAGHYAVNNDIHHYSRRKRTNCPGISLHGVGQRMAHNFIHDAPHTGMFYSGNDHIIEFNEATRLCYETGDVGVFYSGRNWTFRGNVVRHNFIHHIDAPGHVGSMAVYLDDSHSSTTICGNVFYKVEYAAFIGGGRDNLVENNIFIDCEAAVHLDNRSQGWAHKYQIPGGDHQMFQKLKDVRHDQPPYSERFPELAHILQEEPHEPRGNVVRRNVCVRGKWLHTYKGAEAVLRLEQNLVTRDDPGFANEGRMDFALRADSTVLEQVPGFQPIPFAKIGLYTDEYRERLPLSPPRIIPDGGAFGKSVEIELYLERDDAEVRFTLDGSDPVRRSQRYDGPLALDRSAVLKAAAFRTADQGALPSPAAAATFTQVLLGDGHCVYLSDLEAIDVCSHGGLKRDTNYRANGPLRLGGKAYAKSILIHAEKQDEGSGAQVTYELAGPLREAHRFRALIGVDDEGDQRGSIVFKVELCTRGDWKELFRSDLLRGGPEAQRVPVDVDITGAEKLRLSVDGGSNIECDHAAWAEARLE